MAQFDSPTEISALDVAIRLRDGDVLTLVEEALDLDRLLLAFQPAVSARAMGHISFHEGLARICDDGGRPIPAASFIPAVEDHELGRRIDCRALDIGLATLAAQEDLRLSLNMSARSIGYGPWMDSLHRGLALSPTVAERLILEITESSAIVMPEVVRAFMQSLQARGICFALDDFGAGYTSFRHLRDLLFDIVKIDGQFINGIASDPDNQVLTQALLSIGQHFEMVTVAEGVETQEDATYLRRIGIDCLQGYYFAAPTIRPAWTRDQRQTA